MSACFYDMAGWMTGFLDMHAYILATMTAVPTPHFVATPFERLARSDECDTLTSDGMKMAKRGFKVFAVPHVPLTVAPPDPASETRMLAAIILTSSTKAIVGRSTVTHAGTPLACCVAGPAGLNGNCGSGIGAVLSMNSVVTNPSAGDLVGAAVDWALSVAFGKMVSKLLGSLDAIPKQYIKWFLGKQIKDLGVSKLINWVHDEIQELVDDVL
jgi:hypothetical protein